MYKQTLLAGIAHAKERAARQYKRIQVYGDGNRVWVRSQEEGEPENSTFIGECSPTGEFFHANSINLREDSKWGTDT